MTVAQLVQAWVKERAVLIWAQVDKMGYWFI